MKFFSIVQSEKLIIFVYVEFYYVYQDVTKIDGAFRGTANGAFVKCSITFLSISLYINNAPFPVTE